MVTAPHALAAQYGLFLMKEGGNAADAAIGMAAALAVLYPHMTGIGGDAFFLYYDAQNGKIHAYNGSGAAAQLATPQYYRDRGLGKIPERGGLAVLTVPGTVDAWFALNERFGTLEMQRILAAPIAYATNGAPAARSLVSALHRLRDVLAADEGAAAEFVSIGPSSVGQRFSLPTLGATLQSIASHGRSWFYEGEGARQIDEYCKRINSPLRAEDLAAHRGFFDKPAAGKFAGFGSMTTPPNSQGVALLLAQQIYEAATAGNVIHEDSAAQVHVAVESIRLAFVERDRHVSDPEQTRDWQSLLSIDRAQEEAKKIQPYATLETAQLREHRGDTAYFACVDFLGNAVSFIQSLFFGFGAAVVVPKLGVVLQNRGVAFELAENSPRTLVPRRRPFHTLMPCMLVRDGKPWLVYGSMGGEGQPQTALQLSTRIARDGLDPQSAIEAPRWRWGTTWVEEPPRVNVEARLSPAVIAGLRARGHVVNVLGEWDESMGHAGAIVIDNDQGILLGGADPRSDGAALGF